MRKRSSLKCALAAVGVSFALPMTACAAATVVAIDPGHGGDNQGAIPAEGYMEKNMTLQVAMAMKEELEKYEGVTVVMTREDDRTLSLEERAQIAKANNADMLISLHFNMSNSHRLFGSEVWISSQKDAYNRMFPLASNVINELSDLGITTRGIKTRLSSRDDDYYGVIRNSWTMGIPSVLIEHCHMDNSADQAFWQSGDQWRLLGIADATAVAESLGLTPSDGETIRLKNAIDAQGGEIARPDQTPPDNVTAVLAEGSGGPGGFTIRLSASDAESRLTYYDYSLDGGNVWSQLYPWGEQGACDVSFDSAALNGVGQILFRVYNGYDQAAQSAPVQLHPEASEQPAG